MNKEEFDKIRKTGTRVTTLRQEYDESGNHYCVELFAKPDGQLFVVEFYNAQAMYSIVNGQRDYSLTPVTKHTRTVEETYYTNAEGSEMP